MDIRKYILITRGTEKLKINELKSVNIGKSLNIAEHGSIMSVIDPKLYRSALEVQFSKAAKMNKSSGTPGKFNVEEINTSTPKDSGRKRDCPRGY